jgi:hypothetical protein
MYPSTGAHGMAIAKVKYFTEIDGDIIELPRIDMIPNREFEALIPGVKGRRADSFSRYVGCLDLAGKQKVPTFRTIEYKRNPSLHKCDARCQHAKGHSCECSCGGKNHGKAA